MIAKRDLQKLYLEDKFSMQQVATYLNCSVHTVEYWMSKYGLPRRTISEAVYQRHNPEGDPFTIMPIRSRADAYLYGCGVGLYWGEGNKANRFSIRLGNTDPALLRMFMEFLIKLYGARRERFKFGLQIFTDIDAGAALAYWARELSVDPSQFYKATVTISGSLGTYRTKSAYGVATVMYHNKKLRDILVSSLPR